MERPSPDSTGMNTPQPAEGTMPVPLVARTKSFSDLEVCHRHSMMDEKLPIPPQTQYYANGLASPSSNAVSPLSPSRIDPVPAYAAGQAAASYQVTSLYPPGAAQYPMHNRAISDTLSVYDPKTELPQRPAGSWFESFRQRKNSMLWMIGGGVLALIIILSVALGVVLSRRPSPSSSQASTAPAAFADTQLASVNWTDSSGELRRAVLYQDSKEALVIAIFSERTKSWDSTNISESLAKTNSSKAFDIRKGSPLALAAGFPNGTPIVQLNAYYLSSDDIIHEVVNINPTNPQFGWAYGLLTWENRVASAGSRISAFWQMCPACTNSVIVGYQAPDSTMNLLNYTGFWAPPARVGDRGTPSAGLALSPFTDFMGRGPTGTQPTAWRVYHISSSGLREFIMGPETDFRWEEGNFGAPIAKDLSVRVSPDLTSIAYGDRGWSNNLVTALSSNGTLMSYRWQGTRWDAQQPSFSGGPEPRFDAFATNQDMRMYGLIGSRIEEWQSSAKDAFSWTYVGPVAG